LAFRVGIESANCGLVVPSPNSFVQSIINTHPADGGRKNAIELSASCRHEIGHGTGVHHHDPDNSDPNDNDLKNCTMRYYGPKEFSPDGAVNGLVEIDYFDLAERALS
jgi:hypothetical protein